VTIRRPNNLILNIVFTLLIVLVIALQLTNLPFISLIAVPFVLFCPGYGLTSILFRKDAIGGVERLLLSVGLSIAIAILGGALLNLTEPGLAPMTWLLLLGDITLVASVLALILGRARPLLTTTRIPMGTLQISQVMFLGIGFLTLLTALKIAQLPAPASRVEGYTSLWILPPDANSHVVRLGLNSQEVEPVAYRVEVQVNKHIVQQWSNIQLEPGQAWTNSFKLSNTTGSPIEAIVYRMDQPNTVYRRVFVNEAN